MIKIAHRINTIAELKKIPLKFGVEIDIRGFGNEILLNHDPIENPKNHDRLEEYLKNFKHAFIIFNIKEAGYEAAVIDLAHSYNITNYFLLDIEFPFIYHATRKLGFRNIALRYSEAEPIEFVLAQYDEKGPLADWVFIDTNTKLPLDKKIASQLSGFKLCLVSPDRWSRPKDIPKYKEFLEKNNIIIDAVMVSLDNIEKW